MTVRDFRVMISPTYNKNAPVQKKILAADGVMGVIILLAYYAGGTNLFPTSCIPDFFWDKKEKGTNKIFITVEGLTDLIERFSQVIGREVGAISVGSLPVYLTSLRKGRRANGNGALPPIQSQFFKDEQLLVIHPKDYQLDKELGLTDLIPEGLI